MDKPAHTPGPWKPCRSHEGFDGPFYEPDPHEVAEFNAKPFVRIEAATGSVAAAHDLFEFERADAHLIAAAPALLEALEQAEHWLQAEADSPEPGATKPDEILRVIREAISGATGA